ncbi:MAG TPA: 5'-3' exonuclease H3TH domain-containing protein [Gaiellales bacterium]|nr:5'-3' exonuclease H3TH domain-containing protein [Gaiellales bacterium]
MRRHDEPIVAHLVDGTYELFRHFYGARRGRQRDPEFAAVRGVLRTVLSMLEDGATHLGVATDHVIESFRNDLWPGYKTGAGVDPELRAQFEPLEQSLAAMGVAVWPMVELEADDALAGAAHVAAGEARVHKVCIWTPDKDLAQCVSGERVVQVDRRSSTVRDEPGVLEKFGVPPARIPDYLALVGDSADGYPGIPGIGAVGARGLIRRHGALEEFPPEVLGSRIDLALLFKHLATLRTEPPPIRLAEELRWEGPDAAFDDLPEAIADAGLRARLEALAGSRAARP